MKTDKTDGLKKEVEKILLAHGQNKICLLINTDDYSGKVVKLSNGKPVLINETEYEENSGYNSLERHMTERYSFTENDIDDLMDENSEFNRKLKRYIKSNRILNSVLIGEMSCQTLEDELAEVKGNLIILISKIQELIMTKNTDDVCYLIYGKMSGNYLIERYLRETLSYDADLEDPLLYISSDIVDSGELYKKKAVDSIEIVLSGHGNQKERVNLACSKDRCKGFFGPIYTQGTSTITLESKDEVWNIKLPFRVDDNDTELIEINLVHDENEESILLIKRIASNEIFNIAL